MPAGVITTGERRPETKKSMKTKTNRIHRNSGTKPASVQTKSLQSKRAAGASEKKNTVSAVFFNPDVLFDSDDESVHTIVEFPESVFSLIEQIRKEMKIGLAEFFNRAIRAKLESSGSRAVKGGAQ
jgi:hypothetical protein